MIVKTRGVGEVCTQGKELTGIRLLQQPHHIRLKPAGDKKLCLALLPSDVCVRPLLVQLYKCITAAISRPGPLRKHSTEMMVTQSTGVATEERMQSPTL